MTHRDESKHLNVHVKCKSEFEGKKIASGNKPRSWTYFQSSGAVGKTFPDLVVIMHPSISNPAI